MIWNCNNKNVGLESHEISRALCSTLIRHILEFNFSTPYFKYSIRKLEMDQRKEMKQSWNYESLFTLKTEVSILYNHKDDTYRVAWK